MRLTFKEQLSKLFQVCRCQAMHTKSCMHAHIQYNIILCHSRLSQNAPVIPMAAQSQKKAMVSLVTVFSTEWQVAPPLHRFGMHGSEKDIIHVNSANNHHLDSTSKSGDIELLNICKRTTIMLHNITLAYWLQFKACAHSAPGWYWHWSSSNPSLHVQLNVLVGVTEQLPRPLHGSDAHGSTGGGGDVANSKNDRILCQEQHQ